MTRKEIANLFIRFLITFACMSPLFVALGFLLNGKVTDFVMITIFVVLAGAGTAVEEYIHFKKVEKRKQLKREQMKKGENKNGK